MYTYHPKSWSQQARALSDAKIESVKSGWCTIEKAREFFRNSYRHPLIRLRAAKRFERWVRAGKVKENLEEYRKHFPENI